MNIAIIYESKTGITAQAAQTMAATFEGQGHRCQVFSLSQAKAADAEAADLLCIGCWVKGLFIIGQHPTEGTMRFIQRLDNLGGKDVVLFCTYKLAVGSTLRKMAKPLEDKDANVVGQFKFRGAQPTDDFVTFAAALK